jgi:hypothetical protein
MGREGRLQSVTAVAKSELRKQIAFISMSGKASRYDSSIVETFLQTVEVGTCRENCLPDPTGRRGRRLDSFYNPVQRHSSPDFVSRAIYQRQSAGSLIARHTFKQILPLPPTK